MKISIIRRSLSTLCLTLLLASADSFAEIYKWVDANGQTHFSERKDEAGKASEICARAGIDAGCRLAAILAGPGTAVQATPGGKIAASPALRGRHPAEVALRRKGWRDGCVEMQFRARHRQRGASPPKRRADRRKRPQDRRERYPQLLPLARTAEFQAGLRARPHRQLVRSSGVSNPHLCCSVSDRCARNGRVARESYIGQRRQRFRAQIRRQTSLPEKAPGSIQ